MRFARLELPNHRPQFSSSSSSSSSASPMSCPSSMLSSPEVSSKSSSGMVADESASLRSMFPRGTPPARSAPPTRQSCHQWREKQDPSREPTWHFKSQFKRQRPRGVAKPSTGGVNGTSRPDEHQSSQADGSVHLVVSEGQPYEFIAQIHLTEAHEGHVVDVTLSYLGGITCEFSITAVVD